MEIHYRILRLIEQNPEMSQRQLAEAMGVSLGKLNYILRALIRKGLVKGRNFKNRKNKSYYAYLLTPKGIEEKARATVRFFRKIEAEYRALKQEIEKFDVAVLEAHEKTEVHAGMGREPDVLKTTMNRIDQ